MPKIAGIPMTTIAVRLPPEEAQELRERAEMAGLAHSAFLRQAWRNRPALGPEERDALRRALDHLVRIGGNLNQLSKHCNQVQDAPTLTAIRDIQEALVPVLQAVRGVLHP